MPVNKQNLSDQEIVNLYNKVLEAGDAVLIGGSAMRAHGIERRVEDVDAYLHPNKPFTAVLPPSVDVTDSDYIWGRLSIGDIRKSPAVDFNGIKGKAISLETLFITKAEAARDKDIADLQLLAPLVTPETVMRRLGELRKYNDESIHAEFVETALMELQLHFGVIDAEVLQYSGLSEDRIEDLSSSLYMSHSKGIRR